MVGGSKVRSNHGTFRFNLGPGERGEYHEVVCVGNGDLPRVSGPGRGRGEGFSPPREGRGF